MSNIASYREMRSSVGNVELNGATGDKKSSLWQECKRAKVRDTRKLCIINYLIYRASSLKTLNSNREDNCERGSAWSFYDHSAIL